MYYSREEAVTFDDVLIEPQKSSIESRSQVDTSIKLGGRQLELPVLSANMDTITGPKMARAMAENGGIGVLHRFASRKERVEAVREADVPCGFSIGLEDSLDFIERVWLDHTNIKFIVLDVAHGHQKQVLNKIVELHEFRQRTGSSLKIIAGNIATAQGAKDLHIAGADAVKVGIGPGSACTTRLKTGCGVPQLTAIQNARLGLENVACGIIADGGIKQPADVVKALVAGANAVMIGGWFAGTTETPDDREFRGMASREAAEDNGKTTYTPDGEGIAMEIIPKNHSVERILQDIEGGLRSAMTYVGARTIRELQERGKFIRVTQATQFENQPRRV